ncbi:MAG: penicillin-binding protein 2 [Patescibacteria group bacterium]
MASVSFDAVMRRRIDILLLFFLIAYAIVLARLFSLQIIDHRVYAERAAAQHHRTDEIAALRGGMFATDKTGERIPLAVNRLRYNAVLDAEKIGDADAIITAVASTTDAEPDQMRVAIGKNPRRAILARGIDETTMRALSGREDGGLSFEPERYRKYVYGRTLAHVIGFIGFDGDRQVGRYGLERFYEYRLTGEGGFFDRIPFGSAGIGALGNRIIRPPQRGADLVLTIDYNIQNQAEAALSSAMDKWDAYSGLIIVVEPATGRILALGARPAFDPNGYNTERDLSVFLNPAVEASYELGSVLKPVTMAAAIEEGRVGPETTYHDPGLVRIKGYTVENFDGKAYGIQTMTEVLQKSLNTGMVHVARLLGQELQREYFLRFGFGEPTEVDLPGELSGNISNLSSGREIDLATASFGHGVAVTPIQTAMAIAAIANKGVLMRPFVVGRVVDGSGNETVTVPQPRRRVLSEKTAETLTTMLVSAVHNGFENRAGVKGYFVAGKTGTARIPRSDGRGYYDDRVIHAFAGYAPAFAPRFLIYAQLNEPAGNRFAANTLTPTFHDLAEFILNYYGVPPDEPGKSNE